MVNPLIIKNFQNYANRLKWWKSYFLRDHQRNKEEIQCLPILQLQSIIKKPRRGEILVAIIRTRKIRNPVGVTYSYLLCNHIKNLCEIDKFKNFVLENSNFIQLCRPYGAMVCIYIIHSTNMPPLRGYYRRLIVTTNISPLRGLKIMVCYIIIWKVIRLFFESQRKPNISLWTY